MGSVADVMLKNARPARTVDDAHILLWHRRDMWHCPSLSFDLTFCKSRLNRPPQCRTVLAFYVVFERAVFQSDPSPQLHHKVRAHISGNLYTRCSLPLKLLYIDLSRLSDLRICVLRKCSFTSIAFRKEDLSFLFLPDK